MLAFFDSGYGGLSIFSEVRKLIPQYDYLYFGDNARAPYGERSHEIITRFTRQAVSFLFQKEAVLIILACNAASSAALRVLQEEFIRKPNVRDKNILGVIRPVAEEAACITRTMRVGVVGTRATINSKAFEHEIHKLNSDIKVYSKACSLLVPLIEEGYIDKPETIMILKKYVRHLKDYDIDTLVLACTHYPFLMKQFKRIFGKKVSIIHPGMVVGRKLVEYLSRHPEIEKNLSRGGTVRYFTSEHPGRFHDMARLFLGEPLKHVEHVDLDQPPQTAAQRL